MTVKGQLISNWTLANKVGGTTSRNQIKVGMVVRTRDLQHRPSLSERTSEIVLGWGRRDRTQLSLRQKGHSEND